MKRTRLFLCVFLAWASLPITAQEIKTNTEEDIKETHVAKFGYISYNEIFQAMPEYEESCKKLDELKTKYDNEAKRSEEEFQRKFTEFIENQKNFPENILLKRQYELQDLMTKSINFKEEAGTLLSEAEKELQANIIVLLDEAIRTVGIENGYDYIINTDGKACPFINVNVADDVTNLVKEKLCLPLKIQQ